MKAILESKEFDVSSISILSVAQRCGVSIQKLGHNYVAKCPFHSDATPSLVFYISTNSWACFGKCQGKNGRNGGDVAEFVKQYYHFDFADALKWIRQNFDHFEPVVIKEKPTVYPSFVPPIFVSYWHSLLGEHREYFNNRGFTDDFIDRELWGWDGKRYCLPVWEDEPGNSEILGVRRRKADGQEGEKYIGLKDMNPPTVWGRWYCRDAKTILAFAGEFDAALANQDKLPGFSIVNGINSLDSFPDNWSQLWFPNSQNMIAVFDKKEESFAGRLCQHWNKIKGSMTARVFHWPTHSGYKDYCEFRQYHSIEDFRMLADMQGLNL